MPVVDLILKALKVLFLLILWVLIVYAAAINMFGSIYNAFVCGLVIAVWSVFTVLLLQSMRDPYE